MVHTISSLISLLGVDSKNNYTSIPYIRRKLEMPSIFSLILFLNLLSVVNGDFFYADFNQTLGLIFNGAAKTTKCIQILNDFVPISYNNNSNIDDKIENEPNDSDDNEVLLRSSEEGGMQSQETMFTEGKFSEHDVPHKNKASAFGSRARTVGYIRSECSTRLRLTPSARSKAGSVWYQKRIPVVIDQSIMCSDHRNPSYAHEHYRSCAVHGGDGFAFVIHGDKNETSALGENGQELGYGGISNSLAIEFDMWTNVKTQGSDDFFFDHISIHSGSTKINSSGSKTSLGYARPVDLADGERHTVKIRYIPYIEYLEYMTANDNLLPYLKDNGEGRRLGTLAIFINQGLKDDKPILAIPLNLSVLLDLPESLAYVGFTASTGEKWQKHDILNWHWCDTIHCHGDPIKALEHEPGNEENLTSEFLHPDYSYGVTGQGII